MDTQGTGHTINELSRATIAEELVHRPFHSDHCLDGVSRRNLQNTALGQVEFKDVLDTDEPVLSAEPSLNLAILLNRLIPLVHVNSLAVLEDLSRLGAWVGDTDDHLQGVVLGVEVVLLLLWWRASVNDIVGGTSWSVDNDWEAGQPGLTGVETVPDVVHVTVDLVVHVGALQPCVNRLH